MLICVLLTVVCTLAAADADILKPALRKSREFTLSPDQQGTGQNLHCPQTSLSCPNGWIVFDNSCYLFADEILVNWTEATQFCASHDNAHLVTIESKEEDLFINGLCKRFFKYVRSNWFWIGATDEEVEGNMVWYTNKNRLSEGYSNWHAGEPSGISTEECAVLWGPFNYAWGDYYCRLKSHAICEKNMIPTSAQQIIG